MATAAHGFEASLGSRSLRFAVESARWPIACVVLLTFSWCAFGQSESRSPNGARQSETAEDGQWPMAAKNYANTRYSGLDQIKTENAKDLKVAWTFSTGVNRGQEAAPVVVGDTMYLVTPYPNIVYALDLAHEGAIKWKFEPEPSAAAQGVACCDVVNRGVSYSAGKIFFNTLDDQTFALDA